VNLQHAGLQLALPAWYPGGGILSLKQHWMQSLLNSLLLFDFHRILAGWLGCLH
jgi:hypothetical protein